MSTTQLCGDTMSNRTIHIGNLASNVTEDILRVYFEQCGRITNMKLAGDPQYPARFAFIEFAEPSSAQYACSNFNGLELGGKLLKIQLAKTAISTPPPLAAATLQKSGNQQAGRTTVRHTFPCSFTEKILTEQ